MHTKSENRPASQECVSRTDLGFGCFYICRTWFGHPCKEPQNFGLFFRFVWVLLVFVQYKRNQNPKPYKDRIWNRMFWCSFKKVTHSNNYSQQSTSLQWLWWIWGHPEQVQVFLESKRFLDTTMRFLHYFWPKLYVLYIYKIYMCVHQLSILHLESSQVP